MHPCEHFIGGRAAEAGIDASDAQLAHRPDVGGDEGTLGGRPCQVLGRVQLDHGAGPWDEYYVALDGGQSWGWLAFAQGHWYATSAVPGIVVPNYQELRPGTTPDAPVGESGFVAIRP